MVIPETTKKDHRPLFLPIRNSGTFIYTACCGWQRRHKRTKCRQRAGAANRLSISISNSRSELEEVVYRGASLPSNTSRTKDIHMGRSRTYIGPRYRHRPQISRWAATIVNVISRFYEKFPYEFSRKWFSFALNTLKAPLFIPFAKNHWLARNLKAKR